MTNDELLALLARLLRKRGLRVKEWSEAYVANKIRGEGDERSAATIDQRLDEMAREESIHFAPLGGKPTPTRRQRAEADLERINAHAHATRPSKAAPKLKLTAEDKQRCREWGAGYLLDVANERAVEFEDESNVEI
ncbi:MAG: hypothetical protein ACJ8IR_04250 [Alphaproteobacteria bacterium]